MDPLMMFRNEPEAAVVAAGGVIFRANDLAESMYVVLDGEVEVVIGDRRIAVLGPGEIFGEMALVEHKPRNASAIARTDCRLAVVGEKRFIFLVQNHPFFALHVMRVLAGRLRWADSQLVA